MIAESLFMSPLTLSSYLLGIALSANSFDDILFPVEFTGVFTRVSILLLKFEINL